MKVKPTYLHLDVILLTYSQNIYSPFLRLVSGLVVQVFVVLTALPSVAINMFQLLQLP
jgi:hypothetical protein